MFSIATNKEIRIHEVYSDPFELSHDHRILKELEYHLINRYFRYADGYTVSISIQDIRLDIINIINDIKLNINKHIKKNINVIDFDSCFKLDSKSLLGYLETVLRRLKGQCLIYWSEHCNETEYSVLVVDSHHFEEKMKREIVQQEIKDKISNLDLSKYELNTDEQFIHQGIYGILNKTNKKIYIGSSIDIHKRIKEHISSLKSDTHYNAKLQSDYKEYPYGFEFLLIEIIDNILDLPRRELQWINEFGGLFSEHCYNLSNPMKEDKVIGVRNEINASKTMNKKERITI